MKAVKNSDIRMLKDLLSMCPCGRNNRLPKWLYGDVVADLSEDGWVLMPA